MDATPLFPEPWHPVEPSMKADWSGPSQPLSRKDHPVKYYFIDFGMSKQFDLEKGPPRVLPLRAGGLQRAPEFKGKGFDVEQDPFPTDVWYIGNFVREEFLVVCRFMLVPRSQAITA
jgi:hypothetical protein